MQHFEDVYTWRPYFKYGFVYLTDGVSRKRRFIIRQIPCFPKLVKPQSLGDSSGEMQVPPSYGKIISIVEALSNDDLPINLSQTAVFELFAGQARTEVIPF